MKTEELSDFCHALTEIDQKQNITVGDALLQEIKDAIRQDPTSQELKDVILKYGRHRPRKFPKKAAYTSDDVKA